MTSSERLELEIDLLEKRKQAIESDQKYKLEQYNNFFFTEAGMSDDVFRLVMRELNRDRDQLDVEIAEEARPLRPSGCPCRGKAASQEGKEPGKAKAAPSRLPISRLRDRPFPFPGGRGLRRAAVRGESSGKSTSRPASD